MGLRRRAGSSGSGAADPAAGDTGGLGAGLAAAELAAAAGAPTAPDTRRTGRSRRERKPLTPARAKRLIGVGTAVAPLLAPYAMAAAGAARARWDAYRAARMGVTPDQLSAFAGRGGALHARLSRIAESLVALESPAPTSIGPTDAGPDPSHNGAHHGTPEAKRFAATVRPRLEDLAVAVRAAEQMPAPRRRTAFRAISGELDRIEAELLTHLGVEV